MNNVDIERITTENLSSMAFICDDRVYLIEFMGYNTFDYMHKGGIAAFREDTESFNKLSDDEKMELAVKNIEDFFEIIQSIHQDNHFLKQAQEYHHFVQSKHSLLHTM